MIKPAPPLSAAGQPVSLVEEGSPGAARTLRGLVWLYLFLLIFEGAFRKWFTPGLSTPLLVVRDPVALLIYLVAAGGGYFPKNPLLTCLWILSGGMIATALAAQEMTLPVFLFGVRTDFLHVPLVFLIPRIMRHDDVVRVGRWFLLAAIPMTVLVALQFRAAPSSMLNAVAGGPGTQLESSGGHVRTSGTFSFISGVISFYALVAAFMVAGFLRKGLYPAWLRYAGALCTLVAVATSGSRSAALMMGMVGGVLVLAAFLDPRLIGRLVMLLGILGLVLLFASQLVVVKSGMESLTMRFAEAGGGSGVWPRIVKLFTDPFRNLGEIPFFGLGLGFGTNAGASLASTAVRYRLVESEWDRMFRESGPLMGGLFIAWRVSLAVYLGRVSWRALQEENLLPLLIFSGCGLLVMNGQWGQPTSLGFAIVGSGFCLAAARHGQAAGTGAAVAASPGRVRGRSRYADHLLGTRGGAPHPPGT